MGRREILCREDVKPGRKIVLVDRLGHLSRQLVSRSASSGQLVVFMDAVHGIRRKAWFQTAVGDGTVRWFAAAIFPSFGDYWRADDAASDAVEVVYAAMKQRGKVPVAPLVELYGDETIEAAFKKQLIVRLAEFFRTVTALKFLSGDGRPVEFYPSAAWEEVCQWVTLAGVLWELPNGVTITRSWRFRLGSSIDWVWGLMLVGQPLWVFLWALWGSIRGTGSETSPHYVQVALLVYATDWGFRGEGTREIDWLLNGKDLHRDNTLFVIEKPVPKEYRAEFTRRGYRFMDVSRHEAFRCVSWAFLLRELVFRGVRAWAKLVFARSSGMFNAVVARGWLDYFRWTAFLERWKPQHYVVYNHFHFEHLFRSVRLRAAGCKSWYYVHSLHDSNVCFYLANPIRSQADWAYVSYDNEVHWGRRDANYMKRMSGLSGAYKVWGPLWSAHVSSVPGVAFFIKQRQNANQRKAIVAAFDAPSPLYWEIGAQEFLDALTAMLDRPEWSSRMLVYKPKYDLAGLRKFASSEAVTAFERLRDHPHCMLLDAGVAPGAVIAEADLTVSIAYTTTTVEALGARRRAFFFDPGGKLPNSYYDQFPNLVAHDRDALARLCEHWLGMLETDFQKYLDKYIAPEFAGHLDSGAVARFRAALACE